MENPTIQKAYKASAAPTNVLIDTEGRAVARPELGSAEQERWLGAWIELLLGSKQRYRASLRRTAMTVTSS